MSPAGADPSGAGPPAYRFENRGRSRRAAVALPSIWGALLALMHWIDLSPWIAGAVALFTLPAAWEFLTDPRASLCLDDTALTWRSATQRGEVALARIHFVRFDTRLDLSVRITVQLKDGQKLRLPHACTPPHRSFEAALQARGVTVRREHFSLIG